MAVCKICNKWKETVDSMVQHLMSEKPDHGVSWLQIQIYPAKYYELDPGMQVPRTPRPKRKREDADDDDQTMVVADVVQVPPQRGELAT